MEPAVGASRSKRGLGRRRFAKRTAGHTARLKGRDGAQREMVTTPGVVRVAEAKRFAIIRTAEGAHRASITEPAKATSAQRRLRGLATCTTGDDLGIFFSLSCRFYGNTLTSEFTGLARLFAQGPVE